MSKEIKLTNFQNQISAKNTNLEALHERSAQYSMDREVYLMNIKRLEQEVVDLLFYKKKMIHELNHLTALTAGEGSPMGRIKFFKQGILESSALQIIQDRITEHRAHQQETLDKIDQNITHINDKIIDIEMEIDQERNQLILLEQQISTNQQRIHQLKTEVASIHSQIRTLT